MGELAHIWVQLGNMSKEGGDHESAAAAYSEALRLEPRNSGTLVQMGHLQSSMGDHAAAGIAYFKAFEMDPALADAAAGLDRAMSRVRGKARDRLLGATLVTVVGHIPPAPTTMAGRTDGATGPGVGPAILLDVSDLIEYFRHRRLPTGIQRVQIQVVTHLLGCAGRRVALCCFRDGREDWLGLDAGLFAGVMALSGSSPDHDPIWNTALYKLSLHLARAEPFQFPTGALLVVTGASWRLPNYFLFVRAAKERFGVRYIPLIHDLTAILTPQYINTATLHEAVPWVVEMMAHVDGVLAISQSTKRDFLHVGAMLGRSLDPAVLSVIPLDADFRSETGPPLPMEVLGKWALDRGPFVLLVSTVEPRKGHATAFAAWSMLIARHGAALPRLVCVGANGWFSEGVHKLLEQDLALAAAVSMLSSVSDAELALLYRTCLFTIYPSAYEGWGLPITEAFCHAKPVITSDTSSMPEAGGDFAVYVPPGSVPALAEAVERLAFDAPHREAIIGRLKAEFRPRSWDALANQVGAELARMDRCLAGIPPVRGTPQARLGAYHPFARNTLTQIVPGVGARDFRRGTGWTPPDDAGSWTTPSGGFVAMRLPPCAEPLHIQLLLLGAPRCDIEWRIEPGHGPAITGQLRQNAREWVTFACPASGNHTGEFCFRLLSRATRTGDALEATDATEIEPDAQGVLAGVAGLVVCGPDRSPLGRIGHADEEPPASRPDRPAGVP